MGQARFLLVTGYRISKVPPVGPGFGAFVGRSSGDGSWVAWRLVGANNRELARSANVYSTTGGCLTAVAELRQRASEAEALVSVDYASGLWVWRLDLAGRRVAVSARGYQRRREAHYGLDQFLSALADAATGLDAVIMPTPRARPKIRLLSWVGEEPDGPAQYADPGIPGDDSLPDAGASST